MNECDKWIIFGDTYSKGKKNDHVFPNACLTYLIKYYDEIHATDNQAPIPINVLWTDNCPGQYRCRQFFLNVATKAKHHDNKTIVVHKLAMKYRFKGSWDATGKLAKERTMNNELKLDCCFNAMVCYLKLTRDLAQDGSQSKMQKLVKYEEDGDARVLKNTPFTATQTHIGFRTEDKNEYTSLLSHPDLKHIIYTPQDKVPDMETIKGTMLIAQVNGCEKPNSDGKWSIQHSILPCFCASCRDNPTDYKSYLFHTERETKQEIISLSGEPKARDNNDLHDLKARTVNQLKDELRERCLPLSGLKPELVSCLTNTLTVEHDLGDDNEEE